MQDGRKGRKRLDYEYSPFFLEDSRPSETRARVKITLREKGKTRRGERTFLAWGDSYARSTNPEEWGLLVV